MTERNEDVVCWSFVLYPSLYANYKLTKELKYCILNILKEF